MAARRRAKQSVEQKVAGYIKAVKTGKRIAGKLEKLAVARYERDLKRRAETGFHFDRAAALRVCEFFPLLKHYKGRWAGRPIELEPWQLFILWNVFGWKRADGTRRFRTVYEEIARKNGKALWVDTPIPTPSGWSKMGVLKVGDEVFDERGKVCRVTFATEIQHQRECYRVTFSDGTSIVADADHLWQVSERNVVGPRLTDTSTLARRCEIERSDGGIERRYSIPVAGPLRTEGVLPLPVPPYTLGAWLGDGHAASARITCFDVEIIERIRKDGVPVEARKSSNTGRATTYQLGPHRPGAGGRSFQSALVRLGVLNEKHLPPAYLRAPICDRLELLRGLMDTDGHATKAGQCEFTTTSEVIALGVMELVRSLGFKPSMTSGRATLYGRDCGPKYRIQFCAYADLPVFHVSRKAERLKPAPAFATRASTRQVVSVARTPSVPVRCIQVDSLSHLYLAGESMVPTHNTTKLAGIGLYLAFFDDEPGADVYAAATKRDQARICHGDAVKMVGASPGLGIEKRRDNLHMLATASKFEPLGADADTMDGLNVHGAIVDEFHAHKNRDVLDRLETGVGARTQPLVWMITTAGDDQQSPCFAERERARFVLEGVTADDTLFAFIASPDEGDDWTDERTWSKGNPNLGVSVTVESLRDECNSAQQSPSKQNAFRRFRLNEWTRTTTRFLDLAKWDICSGLTRDAQPIDILETRQGAVCYGGLDLSSKTDLTAFALVFPPSEPNEGTFDVALRFWVPEEGIYEREKKDGVPYARWVEEGWIVATPGPVIDYAWILKELTDISKRVQLQDVAFDGWGSTAIRPQLEDAGLLMVEFGQGFKSMSDPTKELERLTLSKRIRHGGNPVLRWNADCVEVQTDPAGNMKPVKPDIRKSTKRIDGIVAMIMALSRAIEMGADPEPDDRSIYEEQELLVL
jgi:phage terminase large subunit-like protein